MQLPKILLVEDDRSITDALSEILKNNYGIVTAATGELAFYRVDTGHYDLVVLDLDLPDMSGMSVCRQLRERGFKAPILVLTADDNTLTKINLLDAGANDYLTKPFSLGEFKARLRALTRSSHLPPDVPATVLIVDGLRLDRETRKVSRDGITISLRRKGFTLLEYLMEHAGSVVTRRSLIRYAWPGADTLWTNTVDVHIKYLRDKVDRPFGQPLIRTVHGFGYKLEATKPEIGQPLTDGEK